MAITKKQKELDEIKWNKSVEMGADACGSFDYCAKCDKTKENPCDKAFKAYNAKPKKVKEEVAVSATKNTAKKSIKKSK